VNLDTPAAMVAITVVVAAVTAWGGWFSARSACRGPGWALMQLERWRPLSWALAGGGALVTFAVDPVWLGVAVVYVGLMTGLVTRTVRRRLEDFQNTYGEFDPAP